MKALSAFPLMIALEQRIMFDAAVAATADDTLLFRIRIDNPTSSSYYGGVAIVGMDANCDGKVDIFFGVDGRNNGQVIRILDPGTDQNISPSSTSTAPIPAGWLPNSGIYTMSPSNYAVTAVSASSDPHWNGSADVGGDGKTDVFVSFRIPMADIAAVLAKLSPVDRSGVAGPRGTTGIAGYTKDTVVQYVNFTQAQMGPINGDLNGVGASYDKNATFASLGAFTAQMSAANPVASGPSVTISEPIGGSDSTLNDAEDNSVTIAGTTTYVSNGAKVTLTVTHVTNTTPLITGSSSNLPVRRTQTGDTGNIYSDSATGQHDKSGTATIDSITNDTNILSDFITSDQTLIFSGSASANAVVVLTLTGPGNRP